MNISNSQFFQQEVGNDNDDNEDEPELHFKPLNTAKSLLQREHDAKGLILRLIASTEPKNGKEACWNWKCKYGKLPILDTLYARAGRKDGNKWKYEKYNGYPVAGDYWGSYCMDGLAMALHCVYTGKSMGDTIEKCVNLLGDADSTGAVCGQIAGAIYGYQSMVRKKEEQFMIEQLVKWDDYGFAFRGLMLHILGDEKLGKELSCH